MTSKQVVSRKEREGVAESPIEGIGRAERIPRPLEKTNFQNLKTPANGPTGPRVLCPRYTCTKYRQRPVLAGVLVAVQGASAPRTVSTAVGVMFFNFGLWGALVLMRRYLPM